MKTKASTVWKDTLSCLEPEVTQIAFDTYFRTIAPIDLYDDTFVLGVDSEIHKNFIGNRYRSLIENAIKHVTSRIYKLDVVLKSEYDKGDITKIKQGSSKTGGVFITTLFSKYTFDNFVIGDNNRFAHAAAVAVAEDPANAYNPFYLYGGSGLGKTHILQAIANHVLVTTPKLKVLYVTSENFTNDLIVAIKSNKTVEFRERYRNIDVLLVDDIQFIGGKEGVQEEFFHTFNALYNSSKQIVITSDKAPRDIKNFEERLLSRFEWGLTADIQLPEIETRMAILKKKASQKNFVVSDDILWYIAEKIPSNVRDMEGALNKLVAYSSLYPGKMDIEAVKVSLNDMFRKNQKKELSVKNIITFVSKYFDVSPEELISKKRSRTIAFTRQIAMYLCRSLTDASLPKIGDHFGRRDHTTVMYSCDKIATEYEENSETRVIVDELVKIIRGR
jgi:chromosomal replication initiator protein